MIVPVNHWLVKEVVDGVPAGRLVLRLGVLLFRPTSQRRRVPPGQNRTFGFAPILVMQRAADASPQQTLSLTPATQQNLELIQALQMRRAGGLANALRIISGDTDRNQMREAEVSLDGMLGNAAI